MGQPASIRCVSCGFTSESGFSKCPRCGAAVAKICKNCNFSNPANNKVCDNCGAGIELPQGAVPAAPTATFAKIDIPGAAPAMPPQSGKTPQMPLPPAGPQIALRGGASASSKTQQQSFAQSFASKGDGKSQVSQPRVPRTPLIARLRAGLRPVIELLNNPQLKKRYGGIFGAVLLVVMLLALFWPKPDEVVLVERVKAFVESASSGRYERARAMLAKASREDASPEAFAAAVKAQYPEKRIFRAFQPVELSTGAASVSYMYQAPNGPWRPEIAHMVKEDGKWVRPFGWHLYFQLDQALEKNPQQAAVLLEKLGRLDPYDPKLNGYSCGVYFSTGNFSRAAVSCLAASSDSVKIPFLYKPEEELAFRFKLADSYIFTSQVMKALQEYTAILVETQDLPPEPFCAVAQQLVQGYVRIGNYDAALNEAVNGYEACVMSGKKKEISSYLYKLSGNYPEEAVKIAAAHQPAGWDVTLQGSWEKLRPDLKQRYGLRSLPQAHWEAQRVSGPHYRVRLISEAQRGARSLPEMVRYDLVVDIVSGRVVSYPRPRVKPDADASERKRPAARPQKRPKAVSKTVSRGGK